MAEKIKPKRFVMVHDAAKANMLQEVSQLPVDGNMEVVIQPIKKDKTLAQLGGFWGPWLTAISEETGEDKESIAQDLKARFLAKIYIADHMDEDKSEDPAQAQWCELLEIYKQSGDQEKFSRQLGRISLAIANLDQMRRFMNDVDNYYANQGIALPFLDKFRRSYD